MWTSQLQSFGAVAHRQTRFSSGSLGALRSSESWVVIAAAGLSLLALHAAVTTFALQFVLLEVVSNVMRRVSPPRHRRIRIFYLQRVNIKTGARSYENKEDDLV